MAYAERHPEHVAGLILVDSAGPKWNEKSDVEDKIYPDVVERMKSIEFAADFGDKAARDEYSREDFSMLYYSPEKREMLASVKFNWEVNEAVSKDLVRFDLPPELSKFRFPTLVITGRFDAPVFAYQMYRAIPGAQFTVFEKSGHLLFAEEPEGFASRV